MKMFKIETLGSEYLFVLGGMSSAGAAERNTVHVLPSQKYDFAVSPGKGTEPFMPDMERAVAVFLKYVLGYPAAEYEIEMPSGVKSIYVPKGDSIKTVISSRGVCKESLALEDVSVLNVSVADASYSVLICSDERGVDTDKLGARIKREHEDADSRLLLALSSVNDGYRMSAKPLTNRCRMPDSRAYAASAAAIRELGGRVDKGVKISFSDTDVYVCYTGSGFELCSTDAAASRVYL